MMYIHHVGYLVKKIAKARAVFIELGYREQKGVVYDECRDTFILFMEKDGYTIELVSPGSKESVVYSLIKRYKNTPYHICYCSDDFERDIQSLEETGFMKVDCPTPAPAIDNCRACFIISSQIGLVELLEADLGMQRQVSRG